MKENEFDIQSSSNNEMTLSQDLITNDFKSLDDVNSISNSIIQKKYLPENQSIK